MFLEKNDISKNGYNVADLNEHFFNLKYNKFIGSKSF